MEECFGIRAENPRALLSIFKSLRHRNFAIYFAGMLFSLVGAWIQQVAMGWLVYNLTNSVFILSLSVFLGQIPALFLRRSPESQPTGSTGARYLSSHRSA